MSAAASGGSRAASLSWSELRTATAFARSFAMLAIT